MKEQNYNWIKATRLFLLAGVLAAPSIGLAATRTVNTLRDETDPSDGVVLSLREAIAASSAGDTINFSVTGTITLTNELVIGRSLTIIGPPPPGIVVSGNYASRVFNIGSGMTIIIANLTISNGRVVGADGLLDESGADAEGGGILNYGILNLANCLLSKNSAIGGNGGHSLDSENGGAGGAAIGGGIANKGTLNLTGCTLSNNSAAGGIGGDSRGGGLAFYGGVGGAGNGGGISSQGSLSLENCTFSNNSAVGGAGTAGPNGGIGGNAVGGVIDNLSTLTAINCTLSGNSATGGRGGSASFKLGGDGGNAFGGGVFDSGSGNYLNTIIANNTVTGGGGGLSDPLGPPSQKNGANGSALGPDVDGPVSSQGHNLIGQRDGSNGWVASDRTGSSNAPLDPQLGPLQDNGGPTPTMALLPSSAAIDAGDDEVIGPPYHLSTDQRGRPRPTGDHVDIGAYEFGGITRLVTTPNDSGGGSLRDALSLATASDRILFAPVVTGKIRLTTGELLVNKPLTIIGPGASRLAISGNNNSRVFHVGQSGAADIYGLTITEGRVMGGTGMNGIDANGNGPTGSDGTPGGPGETARGGGILNEGALRLFDCMLTTNSVQGGVGGVGGAGFFTGSFIYWPPAQGGVGGGGVGGAIFNGGLLELVRCTILGNMASGGLGGRGGTSDVIIVTDGGQGGTGGVGQGAGLYAALSTRLENCTVAANRAVGGRGGLYGTNFLDFQFGDGTGGEGGPAYGGGVSGALVLNSCTISGNAVAAASGEFSRDGTTNVPGVDGFSAGGGVYCSTLDLRNTLIAGNPGTNGPDVAGAVSSQGWNLIGITDGSSGWMLNDLFGNAVFPLHPLLSPCQDNGGPVWTMGPLAGSPARDAGNSGLPTDARGGPRIVDFPNLPNAPGGNGSDIGALEVDALFRSISITRSNTAVRVKFKTDPGILYTLQQTSAAANPSWTNIVGTLLGNGQELEATDSGSPPSGRFYRVRSNN